MGIKISSGFDLNTARPIDSRLVKTLLTDRDAIHPTLRYEGLTIYVKETGLNYQLVGGIDNSNWALIGAMEITSGLLYWDANRYEPYGSGDQGVLYTGIDTPTWNNRLNYGGNFHATELYQGETRVATIDHLHAGVYENALGNPETSGMLLSSTSDGERYWTAYPEVASGGAWGSITGDLAEQGDLVSALAGKLDSGATAANSTLFGGNPVSYFQPALINPVAGTGTNGYVPRFTGASTIGNSLLQDDGVGIGVGGAPIIGNMLSVNGDTYVSGNIYASGNIIAFSAGGTGGSFWDDMPLATAESIGGIMLGGGVTRYLREDGTWQIPEGTGEGGSMTYPSGSGIPLVVAGAAWGSTIPNNSANWDLAYSWGNHAAAGYSVVSHADVLIDGDFTSQGIMLRGATPGSYSILPNYSTNWNTAYSWGNHASAGYITTQTSHADVLVDGDFTSNGLMKRTAAGVYAIVSDASTNWNTAFGWGNHASAGYAPLANPTFTGTASGAFSGSFATTNFSIVQESGKLVVKYNGSPVFSISSTGSIIALNEITDHTTP